MDPVTVVFSALLAGVAAGATEAASTAIKDAYNALKVLLQDRFSTSESAKIALNEFEKDPETWEAPLRKAIVEMGVDEAILRQSELLLKLVPIPESAPPASKYDITIRTAKNIAIGDQSQARYTDES